MQSSENPTFKSEGQLLGDLSEQKQRIEPETDWCPMGTKAIQVYKLHIFSR